MMKEQNEAWMDLPTVAERYAALMASMGPTVAESVKRVARERADDADLDWSLLIGTKRRTGRVAA